MIITAPVHGQDNIDVEGCYSVHRASAVLPLVDLTCDGVGRDKQKTDSRFDSAMTSRVEIPMRSRKAGAAETGAWPSEFAGFSFKNPAPMTFCKAVKRRGQPGAVENPGNPPSSGASIGGVPRFMGVR